MLRASIVLLLFAIGGILSPVARASSQASLKEAYLAALKRSETLGVQQELLKQADELKNQATASIFPSITGSGTFQEQQGAGSTASSSSPTHQNTVKFTADQPLFRGFRDFALLRQRKALVGAQKYALQNAARQLFYDLSTAFYNVLIYASQVQNFENEIEINQRRLRELRGFLKIGRSRMTDLLTFQANIASLEAQLEGVKTQLETSKDILAFLTGWPRDRAVVEEDLALNAAEKSVDSYLEKIEQRPDIASALANAKAFNEGIPIAFGAHLPSVDLIGNYYAVRPGSLSEVRWDVQLAVTMPLFQGGSIQSQVRQAESISRQYDLLLTQARRSGEQEIRAFYELYRGDKRQLEKLIETANLSKKNFEAETRDYRNGLVTNLEVLQSITSYQAAQRQSDRQKLLVKLDAVKLQAAAAERAEVNSALELAE